MILKVLYILCSLLVTKIIAFDQNESYLVLNHFDEPISGIDESIAANFDKASFNFQLYDQDIFNDVDNEENLAAKYMQKIKELGKTYNVKYVVYNTIKHNNNRLIIEGMLFNTRSGGLISRRKINLNNYENGKLNELNLWFGSAMSQIKNEWKEKRKSILFSDPENIDYEKTPLGAALRSLVVPGWGQAYSGNMISAGVWGGVEFSLALAFILSYNNYNKSSKSFLNNSKLYDATDDEKKVSYYRSSAEKDWDNHVLYSKIAIVLAGTTFSGWISNSVHAWVFGPRPYTNIYQKGRPTIQSSAG